MHVDILTDPFAVMAAGGEQRMTASRASNYHGNWSLQHLCQMCSYTKPPPQSLCEHTRARTHTHTRTDRWINTPTWWMPNGKYITYVCIFLQWVAALHSSAHTQKHTRTQTQRTPFSLVPPTTTALVCQRERQEATSSKQKEAVAQLQWEAGGIILPNFNSCFLIIPRIMMPFKWWVFLRRIHPGNAVLHTQRHIASWQAASVLIGLAKLDIVPLFCSTFSSSSAIKQTPSRCFDITFPAHQSDGPLPSATRRILCSQNSIFPWEGFLFAAK